MQGKLADPQNAFDRVLAIYHRWYAPWFYAYSFALARNHEYESDRIAAGVTSAQTLARALIQVELANRFLADIYWARFLARVEEAPEPPYKPYSLLPRAFKILEKEPSRQQWLTEALRRYAVENDTHPSLGERLAALDVAPHLPPPATTSAALMTLGPAAQPAIDHCDDVWRTQNLANWRKRHDQIREARWKLAEYEQHESSTLSLRGPVGQGRPALVSEREEEAVDSLQQLVARKGNFPDAHMLLAQLLLKYGEEQGLQHLVSAAQQRAELVDDAASIGYGYLMGRGRKGEAMRFAQRIQGLVHNTARSRRRRISPPDRRPGHESRSRPDHRRDAAADSMRERLKELTVGEQEMEAATRPGRWRYFAAAAAAAHCVIGAFLAHGSHARRAVDHRCQRRGAAQDERPFAGDLERGRAPADPRQRNRRRDHIACRPDRQSSCACCRSSQRGPRAIASACSA